MLKLKIIDHTIVLKGHELYSISYESKSYLMKYGEYRFHKAVVYADRRCVE